jgi:WD40 repeat protein
LSANGQRAVSGSLYHGTFNVWDLTSSPFMLARHEHRVKACAERRCHARRHQPRDGMPLLGRRFAPAYQAKHRVDCVALSADSQRAVSGSRDGMLIVWELGSGNVLAVFICDHSISSCAWAGNLIAAGGGSEVDFFELEQ